MSGSPSPNPPPNGPIRVVTGGGLPLRGNDIDTDRVIPARFMRVVSFEGLERHMFEDERAANPKHPFADPRYANARVLVVNANFGCGSSREHAPQGLVRWGIRAIVGESFSEIFRGNAAMLGIPCLASDHQSVDRLQSLLDEAPQTAVTVHVDTGVVSAGSLQIQAALPPALSDAFVRGQWSPTAILLDGFSEVRAVADGLPYVKGF
jgi:3-isopropylmalate/(R)-2-methylmalate dehydratase small subunit